MRLPEKIFKCMRFTDFCSSYFTFLFLSFSLTLLNFKFFISPRSGAKNLHNYKQNAFFLFFIIIIIISSFYLVEFCVNHTHKKWVREKNSSKVIATSPKHPTNESMNEWCGERDEITFKNTHIAYSINSSVSKRLLFFSSSYLIALKTYKQKILR